MRRSNEVESAILATARGPIIARIVLAVIVFNVHDIMEDAGFEGDEGLGIC